MPPEHFPTPLEDHRGRARITFHAEDVDHPLAEEEEVLLRQWIEQVIARAHCRLKWLTYIFCSDTYLYRLNLQYLAHDTFTDIITFPYATPPAVYGDLFISTDRVRENAQALQVPFQQELYRVMIHGVWHLCGQGDKTAAEAHRMRQREDEALRLLQALKATHR